MSPLRTQWQEGRYARILLKPVQKLERTRGPDIYFLSAITSSCEALALAS